MSIQKTLAARFFGDLKDEMAISESFGREVSRDGPELPASRENERFLTRDQSGLPFKPDARKSSAVGGVAFGYGFGKLGIL